MILSVKSRYHQQSRRHNLKSKREKSTSTVGHYITNNQLLPVVLHAKEIGIVTDELIRMIWKVAERYSRKFNFARYTYREDMVASAVMNLCNNALKFDPEKSKNPFSFYTTAIHNSFLQYMADEKKQRRIRDALLVDGGANPSFTYMEEERSETEFVIDDQLDLGKIPVADDELLPEDLRALEEDDDHLLFQPTAKKMKLTALGRSRMPSDVKVYKPADISICSETGSVVIAEGAKYKTIAAAFPKKIVKKPLFKKKILEAVDDDVDISVKKVKKTTTKAVKKPSKKKSSV